MDDQVHFFGADSGLGTQLENPAHHSDGLVFEGGGDLVGKDPPADGVALRGFQDQVCVGTADIYAYTGHSASLLVIANALGNCAAEPIRTWVLWLLLRCGAPSGAWFFYAKGLAG